MAQLAPPDFGDAIADRLDHVLKVDTNDQPTLQDEYQSPGNLGELCYSPLISSIFTDGFGWMINNINKVLPAIFFALAFYVLLQIFLVGFWHKIQITSNDGIVSFHDKQFELKGFFLNDCKVILWQDTYYNQ